MIRKQAERETERVPKMMIANGHMTAVAFPPLKDIEKAKVLHNTEPGLVSLKVRLQGFQI